MRFKYFLQKLFGLFLSKPVFLKNKTVGFSLVRSSKYNVSHSIKSRFLHPFSMHNVIIGDYTYIAKNSSITNTTIGRFCSIGPNFCSGLGMHPTDGVSTSPMFYSTAKQNGYTLVKKSKFDEYKNINIGNDVFIGANVTVLDGVTIGDGAVIGAGAVVVKNIPDYAIAVGVPAKVVKYRFSAEQIEKLKAINWWNFPIEKIELVENYFYDINGFINEFVGA